MDLPWGTSGLVKRGITPRTACGILAGRVGIIVNLLLFAVKLAAAWLCGSVAIAADAVNNLSDAGASVVTLIGFRTASRPPDKKHPFGHGRGEYISALVVAIVIVSVGLNFLKESFQRILHPDSLHVSILIMVILASTILVKSVLGVFYFRLAKRIDSAALRGTAVDSFSDTISTFIVLAGIFLSQFTRFPVDGTAGMLVALLVTAAGIRLVRQSVSLLMGEAPKKELVDQLRNELLKCPGINGVHDIIMHSYGPEIFFATAHAEVNRHGDLLAMHDILEDAEVHIAQKMPIRLILHCDPFGVDDEQTKLWRTRCENLALSISPVLKLYDFRVTPDPQGVPEISFHLLTSHQSTPAWTKLHELMDNGMKQYSPVPRLHIKFIHGYVRED